MRVLYPQNTEWVTVQHVQARLNVVMSCSILLMQSCMPGYITDMQNEQRTSVSKPVLSAKLCETQRSFAWHSTWDNRMNRSQRQEHQCLIYQGRTNQAVIQFLAGSALPTAVLRMVPIINTCGPQNVLPMLVSTLCLRSSSYRLDDVQENVAIVLVNLASRWVLDCWMSWCQVSWYITACLHKQGHSTVTGQQWLLGRGMGEGTSWLCSSKHNRSSSTHRLVPKNPLDPGFVFGPISEGDRELPVCINTGSIPACYLSHPNGLIVSRIQHGQLALDDCKVVQIGVVAQAMNVPPCCISRWPEWR